METNHDYSRDLAEIRSMMERSSKFMLLSGWAGIMAGIYALIGVYFIAGGIVIDPTTIPADASPSIGITREIVKLIALAGIILLFSVGTAVWLSKRKAHKRNEKVWNATANRMIANMAVPLAAGGLLIIILIFKGYVALAPALTLVFYGIALFSAGRYTFGEIRSLGIVQIVVGLAAGLLGNDLLFWGLGFGVLHIMYGIFLHYKYER